MLAWRLFRAAWCAGAIAFCLALCTGHGQALGQPQYWTYSGNGGANTDVLNANNWAFWQLKGGNVPVVPTSSVGGDNGVQDIIINGQNVTGWPAGTGTPYRWGFIGQGGWSTALPNFYDNPGGTTSNYYPGQSLNPNGTAYSFPGQTATIGPGENFSGPNTSGGFSIDGNMHINVAGGNLSTGGSIWDEGIYTMSAAMIYDNSTSGPSSAGIGYEATPEWMWPDSITVSSGGSLSAAEVGSGFQGGALSAGNLTLGVVGNATVNVGSFCAARMPTPAAITVPPALATADSAPSTPAPARGAAA